jgi:hypothetical protein
MNGSRPRHAAVLAGLVGAIGPNAMAQTAALPPLPPPPPEAPPPSFALPPLPADAQLTAPVPAAQPLVSPDPPDAEDEQPDAPPRLPDPWVTRPIMVEGHLGFGTPVGILGIALDYSPWSLLGLNLGIGLGLSGPEYAFTSRVRLLRLGRRTHVAIYLGAGVSANAYDQPSAIGAIPLDGGQSESANEKAHFHWDMAYWANLEAGVEIRLRSRISLRPYLGISRLLNPDPSETLVDVYSHMPPTSPVVPWSGYAGFALGYTMAGW